jgi:hypothetical protein
MKWTKRRKERINNEKEKIPLVIHKLISTERERKRKNLILKGVEGRRGDSERDGGGFQLRLTFAEIEILKD